MKSKRILTFMLAMLMVFGTILGSGITANADEVIAGEKSTDKIAEKPTEELSGAAKRLIALGIIQGKGEGNIASKDNITRAEVTAIILRARGIQSGNYAMTKSFDDVSETAWYAKDLAIAKEMNLVYGVGGNKFAPEKNVTNAELITILIRALNYEKTTDDKVSYPVFHITKAQEAGILKDMTSDINAVSKREDMFTLIDNALNSKVLEPNAFGVYAPSDLTMMEKFLGLKTYKVQIVDSGSLLGGLETGKVKVQGPFGKEGKIETKTLAVENADLLNIDNLFGEVEIILDKDDKVVFTKPVKAKKLLIDTVEDVIRIDREDVIRFKNSTRDYRLSDDLIVIHNYEIAESRNLRNLIKGLAVKYELIDNKVTKIIVEDVREVAIFKELKGNVLEMISGSRINLKNMTEVKVYINGVQSKLEDLKANDLIYKFIKNKEIIIKASRDKVEGKLTTVGKLNNIIKIENKEYTLSKTLKISVDNGSSITTGSLEDLVGEKVIAYLNSNNEIELLIGDVDTKLESIFVIDRIVRDSVKSDGIYDYVSLIDSSGKSAIFKVERRVDLKNLGRGDLVAASFYRDTITDIVKLTKKTSLKYHSVVELTDVVAKDINTRGLTIIQDKDVHYVKSAKTPVFVVGTRNIDVFNFEELGKFTGTINMSLVIRDRDVIAVYINNQDFKLEETGIKGTILDMYVTTVNGKRVTNIELELENGLIEDYILDNYAEISAFANRGFGKKTNSLSDIIEGEIVNLAVDKQGVIVGLHEVALLADLDLVNNVVKSVDRYGLTIGAKNYTFTPKAVIVDARDTRRGVDILTSPLDIPRNALVVFSLDRDKIDNLVIIGLKGDNFENELVYEPEFVKAVDSLKSLVTKYKETETVKFSEIDALLVVVKEKQAAIQSEAAVAKEIADLKSLTDEIATLKTANADKITTFKSALGKLEADLADFKENAETTVTIEQLNENVATAKTALAEIKDKTSIVEEITKLTTLTETVKAIVPEETPEP